jgi:hypothetical protein
MHSMTPDEIASVVTVLVVAVFLVGVVAVAIGWIGRQ